MSRRRSLTAALVASLLMVPLGVSHTASAGKPSDDGLSKDDHELLAIAAANGQGSVTLLIAAKGGAAKQVVSGVQALGGVVGYRDDALGYIRASVPTAKAESVASLAGVQAVDVDEIIPIPDPVPQGQGVPAPQTPPSAATPNNNPYMPTGDTGGAQFVAAHPTWDGRGVTVGIVDTGITLDHPSLLTTSTGERKIVDWVTAIAETGDDDPTWLDMRTQVNGPSFTVGNVAYTAPSAGTFRFAIFNERDPRLGGELGRDVNRDGNPAGSSGLFAVLWNTTSNNVYVDTNQNNNFTDDMAMTDYKVRYDVNYFGTDNPATPYVDRMPFVVQTDAKTKFVNIGIVAAQHGSHVAGIVAGNRLFGGAMSGEAPGAKIVSIRACLFIAGCTAHALIEGMIYAAKQANVDVINMSIGGLPALNDGNNSRCVVYNRLIEQSNVQMFISAGNNGAGLNTAGDPGVCGQVVSVGAYVTAATWASNYGSTGPAPENLHPFSSRGPTEAGGFKPTIVAPGAAVSTTPMWQPGGPVAGTYELPAGYSMLNGTSMASPQSAGAAALLVSAAKQTGVQKQPAQLRQALTSSAHWVPGYGAYEQGNGLINVGAAWALLSTNNVKTVSISSSVAVNTVISQFLATPNVGEGIFDREGVAAGSTYNRQYTFTRTSGGGGTTNYNVSWVGDTSVFTSAGSIALGKNAPATFDVGVHAPAEAGVYSAILNLDDPSTAGIDYQTMNTIVVADEFGAGNNYTIVKSGTVARNQVFHYFVKVPAGTPAFKVDLDDHSAANAGQVRFLRFHPYGVNIDPNSSLDCYSPPVPGNGCNPLSRTVSQPQAGVWEVTVEARRTSDADAAQFTLTMSILGATVSPNPDVIAAATIGVPVARSYTATNLFGAFTGRMVGTTLGSAKRGVFNIADGAQQQYATTVTSGTTSFRATIGGASDPAADLDLFVFNCTAGPCVLAGQSADGDSEESVTIANPAAGTWVVLIDGFAVPAGTTDYNYVDVFVNPAFGSVSVTDANALRPAASSWTAPASVTANVAPEAGRVLLGNVQVRTDTNVLIGSADVVVESVTP
jgi:subtilisin family serine protease